MQLFIIIIILIPNAFYKLQFKIFSHRRISLKTLEFFSYEKKLQKVNFNEIYFWYRRNDVSVT